jgi:hypothetical protein
VLANGNVLCNPSTVIKWLGDSAVVFLGRAVFTDLTGGNFPQVGEGMSA